MPWALSKSVSKIQIAILHKAGKSKTEVTLYRPLNLTRSFGKILEKNKTHRVKNWRKNKNIIKKQQNGFRSKRSTNNYLFKLTQSLKQNIGKRFITSTVFLDVEKTFDQVWHAGLLHKMRNFGME